MNLMFSKLSLRAPCLRTTSLANNMKMFSSATPIVNSYNNPVKHPEVKLKHKTPQKRASSLHAILRKEEYTAMRGNRNWPAFRAGDSIEIEELPYSTATETDKIRGVVVGVFKRASDTCVELVNCEYGTPLIRRVILYNPLVKNVTILKKRFIRGGTRRVKRAKLYYLYDRDPQLYTVSYK